MQTYLVGGAVRDALLDRPFSERDWLVTGATPDDMLKAGYKPVGKDFPVFLHPESGEEYALARTERKSGRGYHGFTFHTGPDVSVEDDLLRRDFTINAMARRQGENNDDTLIDPYGGQADLEARVLRHVSKSFAEDPVRILRGARFAAELGEYSFTVADDTLSLMRQMVDDGEAAELQPERVWKETRRALMAPNPRAFFEVLRACGALAVIFPEVDALFGVPQRADYHPEIDTGEHLMQCLNMAQRMKLDETTRYAVLCHDLGKAVTPDSVLPRHTGHEARGVPLVEALSERLRVPKAHRSLAVAVAGDHLNCHRALELKPVTLEKLLQRLDAYRRPERVAQFCNACEADARGRTGFEDRAYPQSDYIQRAFAATQSVSPKAIVESGVSGPEVGRRLAEERAHAIALVKAQFVKDA